MSTTAPAPAATSTRPAGRDVLERAVAAQAARRRADVEVLEAALAWAHAHVMSVDDDPALVAGWRTDTIHIPGTPAALFGERPVPLAGPGTPLVAEFAVIELAAVLDQSHEATLTLLGDALDLAHRLPRLWALVRDLRVPVRLAREAATASRDLDPAAAGHAIGFWLWQPRRLNPHRIGVLVHEARLYADPDRAIADHDHALATRRVEVHHDDGAPGTSAVFMTLDDHRRRLVRPHRVHHGRDHAFPGPPRRPRRPPRPRRRAPGRPPQRPSTSSPPPTSPTPDRPRARSMTSPPSASPKTPPTPTPTPFRRPER